jgi:uncharacterized membrane-anchored protein
MHKDKTVDLKNLLNRVPEVTLYFWIIKILGTTIGETAADFLNVNLNLGLTVTSIITGAMLAVALFFQFKAKRYVPALYWSAIVLISVFGTLVTDNLTDSIGVPLEASTLFFAAALALTFVCWYVQEKTLSMHSIVTARREAFYWLAILFTFALGTASGDLMAEGLGLGYLTTGILVALGIAGISAAWKLGLNGVLAFWLIYILTRPLGASLGDFLTQPEKYGGLGFGATGTSLLFGAAIIGTVAYLSVTRKDVTEKTVIAEEVTRAPSKGVVTQVVVVLAVLAVLAFGGYYLRQASLQMPESAEVSIPAEAQNAVETKKDSTVVPEDPAISTVKPGVPTTTASASDTFAPFRVITEDTLALVTKGDLAGAKERIGDLEYEWDNAEARLKPADKARWTEVDDAIDTALRQLRAVHQDQAGCESSLKTLLTVLQS